MAGESNEGRTTRWTTSLFELAIDLESASSTASKGEFTPLASTRMKFKTAAAGCSSFLVKSKA